MTCTVIRGALQTFKVKTVQCMYTYIYAHAFCLACMHEYCVSQVADDERRAPVITQLNARGCFVCYCNVFFRNDILTSEKSASE